MPRDASSAVEGIPTAELAQGRNDSLCCSPSAPSHRQDLSRRQKAQYTAGKAWWRDLHTFLMFVHVQALSGLVD